MNTIAIKWSVLTVTLLINIQALAQDVTSSVVDLGNVYSQAGASIPAQTINYIRRYGNKISIAGGGQNNQRQSVVYYDLQDQLFKTERTKSGSELLAYAENTTGLQVSDYDLLISGEDGSPNDKTGLLINDRNGWRFKSVPYDVVHGHMQLRHKGIFFATFGHTSGRQSTPGGW